MNENPKAEKKIDELTQSAIGVSQVLPMLMVVFPLIAAIRQLIANRPWNSQFVFSIIFPIVLLAVPYVILSAYMWKKHKMPISLTKKVLAVFFIIGLALLIATCAFIFINNKEVEPIPVTLAEVSTIPANVEQNEEYYVLYGSENCVFCDQMREVYKKAFFDNRNAPYYYVDLSQEYTDAPEILRRKIEGIPILIRYQNDKEIGRLSGVVELKIVEEFVAVGDN